MSKRETIAYAITHAPPGVKGGPYEAIGGDMGDACERLSASLRWPVDNPVNTAEEVLEEAREFLAEEIAHVVPHARVIRIVRKLRRGRGGPCDVGEAVTRLVAQHEALRAELARLTAPMEGEPSFEHLRDCWDMAPRADASGSDVFRNGFFALYRLGVAHERARQHPGSTFVQATGTHTFGGRPRSGQGPDAPAKDRATDAELDAVFFAARNAAKLVGYGDEGNWALAGALAVAARVRQERYLVAQAVAMGVALEIGPHSKGVDIHVSRPRKDADGGEFFEGDHVEAGCDDVPPADVPSTLARLLGEVSR